MNTNDLDKVLETIENDAIRQEYWYFNGLNNRTINILGEIDDSIIETVILPLKRMEAESEKPIHINIHTTGGSVWDSLVLLDILDKITCPVVIEVLGYAMSMGIYILMAGKHNPNVKVIAHSFSMGLIHAGSVSLVGDNRKVKEIQRFNDRIEAKLKDFVLTHSKITAEEYEEHEAEEWYLLAEDMLRLGIIDEIV